MSAPWWQRGVVYQVYPRSFQDTTGNGIGDLPGITRRLPYLAGTLGVDAVWISPFYPSPMDDFGYDVADYTDVDPLFGSLEDLDELVAAAHGLGLRVIIDWVPNHSSDRHPWFIESRSSQDNARRDWYVWRDAKPDGSPPNNWLSVFGGPAWEWDETTGQYYLHSFLPSQPDLNWRNPGVEAAMFDTLRFWLDRGIDGIRIDVAHFIMKDPDERDNPPAPPQPDRMFKDHGEYEAQVHLHDKGHPDVHAVFRRLRTLLDSYEGERFAVGEIHIFDWDEWAAYYGNGDELHMPYNFSLIFAPWAAAEFRRRITDLERALPAHAWPNYVLGNHDEIRLIARYGADAARAAAVLLLTLRGTPTLYYGDELGLPQSEIDPHRQQDPWGRRVPGQGRDGCRTPMQWTPEPGRGFTAPDTAPWLPTTPAGDGYDVATQLDDPTSILNLYRELLVLRRRHPELHSGSFVALDGQPEGVLGYHRHAAGSTVRVYVNFGPEARAVRGGRVLLSSYLDRSGSEPDLELRPHEAVVLVPD